MLNYNYNDYSKSDPPHQPLYLKKILKLLSADNNIRRVLDAGCGDGNFSESIAKAGYKVFGIDLSDSRIQRAKCREGDNLLFAIASVYDDFRNIFADCNEFDAIISIDVIEHLYDPRLFVKRSYLSVKPNGLVIVACPYWGYLKNIVLSITNKMDRNFTALWDGGHIKHWSFRTLRQLFEEQSFEFIDFQGCGRPIPFMWQEQLMVFKKL
jgi:2-polyprenyl-3-methyl-5-hydroxy-6-metoxy-1,4-benzoquinol methylase